MPRYLLQQWTAGTMREEDEKYGSHRTELWATPSSNDRLLDLVENDVVVIAGVVGRLELRRETDVRPQACTATVGPPASYFPASGSYLMALRIRSCARSALRWI